MLNSSDKSPTGDTGVRGPRPPKPIIRILVILLLALLADLAFADTCTPILLVDCVPNAIEDVEDTVATVFTSD